MKEMPPTLGVDLEYNLGQRGLLFKRPVSRGLGLRGNLFKRPVSQGLGLCGLLLKRPVCRGLGLRGYLFERPVCRARHEGDASSNVPLRLSSMAGASLLLVYGDLAAQRWFRRASDALA